MINMKQGKAGCPRPFSALVSSGTATTYLATVVGDPTLRSSVRGEIGAAAITATMSSSVAGVIT